jgi:agmatine deiminase
VAGVDLNFNGWGNKQICVYDSEVARQVLERLGLERFVAPFVSEGGALVVDGRGTVMATESSIIEPDRNPDQTKEQLTDEILAYVGAEKMLWVPGHANHDITDDHMDSLAHFVGEAKVVVSQPSEADAKDGWARSERLALKLLEKDTNARGEALECLTLQESGEIPAHQHRATFLNDYVNWYVCNEAVLIPAFDDPVSDGLARAFIGGLYPGRTVEQLRIDTLAAGGGGIHCATQQQAASPRRRAR